MVNSVVRRCQALVYKRDTYRYTGGPRHFAMHYTKHQCSRKAHANGTWCKQHAASRYPLRCPWAPNMPNNSITGGEAVP